jgi:glycosyltransferase involved in cell wall biosynthesis
MMTDPSSLDLHYAAPVRLPTEKAHGLQIMQNCEAFAAQGAAVTLYPSMRVQPPELRSVDPFAYYATPRTFRLRRVPTLDALPLFQGALKRLEPLAFYALLGTYSLALAAMLRRIGPEAVIYSRHYQVLQALARVNPPRRLFWEVHKLAPDEGKRQQQAGFANRIGGTITITRHMADRLIAHGLDADRVMVAPDGFSEARFAGMPDQAAARSTLGLPPDAFIVGYMGRLHTLNMSKGVDDIVRAISQHPDRPIHLLLVGGPDDMAAEYRALWGTLGLPDDRFHATGQIAAADVPRALAAFDVAAMPHPWTEYFAYYLSPLKLFEYMASRRAIVATTLPSTQEILTDGETALLVPPADVDALAEAILRLHADADLRGRLADNAHRLVYARYTWEARARDILAFIAARS